MDESVDTSRMKRPIYEMPDWLEQAIRERGLAENYRERPAYQQNDYVHWITSPKREETRRKRLGQMLDELEAGGVYMRMTWTGRAFPGQRPSRARTPAAKPTRTAQPATGSGQP